MGQVAPRVHTDQGEIERIKALATDLPDEAVVELTLDDGSTVAGVVSVRPTLQDFRASDGSEGLNALLRLDDADDPAQAHYVWVDLIRTIRHCGTA